MPRAAGISPGGPGDRICGLDTTLSVLPRDYLAILLGKILGVVQAPPNSISPGPLALIPAALGISESRKTRCATQTLTQEPVFTRRFDIFTEQPPGVCADERGRAGRCGGPRGRRPSTISGMCPGTVPGKPWAKSVGWVELGAAAPTRAGHFGREPRGVLSWLCNVYSRLG